MQGLQRLMVTLASPRYVVQDGKTEYKSMTVADDATAQEFMDFYLDDPSRHSWVCSLPLITNLA